MIIQCDGSYDPHSKTGVSAICTQEHWGFPSLHTTVTVDDSSSEACEFNAISMALRNLSDAIDSQPVSFTMSNIYIYSDSETSTKKFQGSPVLRNLQSRLAARNITLELVNVPRLKVGDAHQLALKVLRSVREAPYRICSTIPPTREDLYSPVKRLYLVATNQDELDAALLWRDTIDAAAIVMAAGFNGHSSRAEVLACINRYERLCSIANQA